MIEHNETSDRRFALCLDLKGVILMKIVNRVFISLRQTVVNSCAGILANGKFGAWLQKHCLFCFV